MQAAFENLMSELAGRRVLTHFDDKRDLFLATDASQYGVGAVLFHQATPEVGSNIKSETAEQVISYVSRTLSVAERNYSQIEKEALAIIFGIKMYDKYLMVRHFTLYTDLQPLVRLFDPKTATSNTPVARIQRWSLFLSNYNYTVEHKERNTELECGCSFSSPTADNALETGKVSACSTGSGIPNK